MLPRARLDRFQRRGLDRTRGRRFAAVGRYGRCGAAALPTLGRYGRYGRNGFFLGGGLVLEVLLCENDHPSKPPPVTV